MVAVLTTRCNSSSKPIGSGCMSWWVLLAISISLSTVHSSRISHTPPEALERRRRTGHNVGLVGQPTEPLCSERRVPRFVDVGLWRGRDPRAIRELAVAGVRVVWIECSLIWRVAVSVQDAQLV